VTVFNHEDTFEPDQLTVNNSLFTIPKEHADYLTDVLTSETYPLSVYCIDLGSKMSFGYNADQEFKHASTIKIAFSLYCCKELQKGRHTLDEQVTYTEEDFVTGSGEIHYGYYGTKYTIRDLIYHSLYDSDNVAYVMLRRVFGVDGFNEMMAELGCVSRMDPEENWGTITAHDLGLIWQEVWQFRQTGGQFGEMLWEFVTTNLYNDLADELTEYETIAHKSGWNQEVAHESGIIVSAERPYVIVLMTGYPYKRWSFYYAIRGVDNIMRCYHGEEVSYTSDTESEEPIETSEQ